LKDAVLNITLEPEEIFVYKCLTRDFTGETDEVFLDLIRRNLQWNFISKIIIENHCIHFIYRVIRKFDEPDYIPKWIYRLGRRNALIMAQRNQNFVHHSRPVLEQIGKAGIPYIVLRGLFFLERLYGNNLSIRSYSDVDLLILKKDLEPVKKILKEAEFTSLDGAFRDRYYEKHHLHLAYVRKDFNLIFEIHWALDHDYTLYQIDIENIFSRSSTEKVIGLDMLVMKPEDLLISTTVHAFKHYPLLKYYYNDSIIRRSLYLDGNLIRLLDVYYLLQQLRDKLNPEDVYEKAKRWEVARPLSITFHALKTIFNPEGIEPYLWKDALPKTGRFENALARKIFSPGPAKKAASITRKFIFSKLLIYREDLYFNPLRIIDLIEYFFPGRAFFIRRFGTRNPLIISLRRLKRIISCALKVGHNVADLAIYSLIRFIFREHKSAREEGDSRKPEGFSG